MQMKEKQTSDYKANWHHSEAMAILIKLSSGNQDRWQDLLLRYPFDICLHSAEEEGRTEDPTENKKREAREKEGKVFLTQELPQNLVVLVGFLLLALFSRFLYERIQQYLIDHLVNRDLVLINSENFNQILRQNINFFFIIFLPISIGCLAVVVLSTMVQTNFFITFKTLRVDLKKIAISWSNFTKKTIFSRWQLINFAKTQLKIVIIGVVAYTFMWLHYEQIVFFIHGDIDNAFYHMNALLLQFMVMTASVLLILAIPDWFLQRLEYLEQLKMSKEDIKQEMKEIEGNPEIKRKQKERARELANRTMLSETREADVVITNPTHYACALKYEPNDMDAPKLVAKGKDMLALRIREIAEAEGIEIVENKPLARSLYEVVEVSQYIPADFFSAVAEILGALDKYKNNQVV